MRNRFCYSLFASLFFFSASYAQLVNIESRRLQTDSSFVLIGNLSLSFNDNNGSEILQFGAGLTSQIKPKDSNSIFLLLGNYNLIRVESVDYNNLWFLHFRYRYKFSEFFRFETFVQSQHDEILDVNSRNLIGAGVRFQLASIEDQKEKGSERFKMYLGNAYMYEEEKSDLFNKRFYSHRHSSYLTLRYSAGAGKVNILNVLYYQPLYQDFSDYRLFEQFKIVVPLSKNEKFNLSFLFDYYLDSVTPQDRKQHSSYLKFGIDIELTKSPKG